MDTLITSLGCFGPAALFVVIYLLLGLVPGGTGGGLPRIHVGLADIG